MPMALLMILRLLPLLLITAIVKPMRSSVVYDDNFDYFKLCLIYPTSVCFAYDDDLKFDNKKVHENICKIPDDAAPWTIHGLWPNRNSGSFPEYCSVEKNKFDLSKLKPIEKKLEKNWPNLFVKRSVSSLWKHEWEKHGVCAGTVEEVNDEVKYFNKTLSLHEKFDIFEY
uniref:Ribonuclease T(2) n=1 Tax=Setaria digitata TaxID=48799 RepID=A0A915Q6N3_9BILA